MRIGLKRNLLKQKKAVNRIRLFKQIQSIGIEVASKEEDDEKENS